MGLRRERTRCPCTRTSPSRRMLNPGIGPPGWRPRFVDYLYLSFTNSTAFSPTDVMPLVPWAKFAMSVQAVISLAILGLVIARAVNVFCVKGSDMTAQSSTIILINGFGVLFVILNSFGLGLRLAVGKLLAEAFAHWKIAVWALVINFVIIPLLFIGYLLTIASSIPEEIKVGFCVAALCAGMPFAPILARLAKADVSIATTLLVVLTAGTIIALPLGLPLAIDAVDAQLKTSAWDVAWPLLLFLLLPVVLGCGFRVWWPDLTPQLARWAVRVAILCLLFNLNFTLVAYWDLFVQTWGTESYIAALAGPFIGLGCGYLLVSSLRVKDVGIRHAAEATTAVRNIAPMLLMMIYPFAADPLVTVSITILNTIGITIVLLFVLMWRRAASPSDTHATTNQPASEGLPPPVPTSHETDPGPELCTNE